MRLVSAIAVCAVLSIPLSGQGVDALHKPFDELLELYVRDGFVYYSALRSDRGRLDRYIAALDGPSAAAHANGTPAQKQALWINAYNALVLRTVINNYPDPRQGARSIRRTAFARFPARSSEATHRVAGRAVTLDAIEKEHADAARRRAGVSRARPRRGRRRPAAQRGVRRLAARRSS